MHEDLCSVTCARRLERKWPAMPSNSSPLHGFYVKIYNYRHFAFSFSIRQGVGSKPIFRSENALNSYQARRMRKSELFDFRGFQFLAMLRSRWNSRPGDLGTECLITSAVQFAFIASLIAWLLFFLPPFTRRKHIKSYGTCENVFAPTEGRALERRAFFC